MALLEELVPQPPPLRMTEGGAIRVGDTRVSLDTVIGAFEQGSSAEEIVLKFPTLRLPDVYAVITYYLWHPREVEAYLEQRRAEARELRARLEELAPPAGIRKRLLARRAGKA